MVRPYRARSTVAVVLQPVSGGRGSQSMSANFNLNEVTEHPRLRRYATGGSPDLCHARVPISSWRNRFS